MKKLNKKSAIDLLKQWAEYVSLVAVIVGFIIALSIKNAATSYVIIFLAGLITGRFVYKKKGRQPLFPFFLIIIFFVLGYVVGTISANKWVVLILFILGTLLSYYAHKNKFIKN